ncbi:MAG TPA: AbrB/MazE/SpoVT family DNA-binding domain-containing protein [Acidimicrobiales bacterium]|nr:AbrB/MazE/SpoVT family DNA-binding domain-containing protein [Acidimicrobiales bacterium]
MRTTIDRAGRLVIPKALRDEVGLTAGEVDVTADGNGLRVEPVAGEAIAKKGGRLVIAKSGVPISDADVRALRDAGQR